MDDTFLAKHQGQENYRNYTARHSQFSNCQPQSRRSKRHSRTKHSKISWDIWQTCHRPHSRKMEQIPATLSQPSTRGWHCNSFTDLIDGMELWDWNVANKDFWSRLAKSLHSLKLSVTWAEKKDKTLASVLVPEKMSWATATRSIRKCKTRIEKIGGSRVDTEPTAWGLDVQVWNLLWIGEEAMKKGIPI